MRYKLWRVQYAIRKYFRGLGVRLRGLVPCTHCNYEAELPKGAVLHRAPICSDCYDTLRERCID